MQVTDYLKELLTQNDNNLSFFVDASKNKQISYKKIHEIGKKVANNLVNIGLKNGDKICTIVDNSFETIVLYLGCIFSGIIVIPIHEENYKTNLNFIIKDSNPKFIFFSKEEIFNNDSFNFQSKILIPEFINDSFSLEDTYEPYSNIDENQTLIIIYTSGTTSKPKGVIHTYKSLLTSAILFSEKVNFPKNCCIPTLLPMSYLGGYFNLFIIPYINRSSIIIVNSFSAKIALDFWNLVEKYNINTLWVVPTIVAMLLKLDRSKNTDKSKVIQKCFVGTDYLGLKLREDFLEKYNIDLLENYGLSETLFISTQTKENKIFGSVGSTLKDVEVKIFGPKKNELKDSQEGEIYIKSKTLSKGYIKKEYEFIDGWFPTGDIGKLINKNLFITGRKKDIIVRGGVNISPAFIEEIVLQDVRIRSAAIIGKRHEVNGEDIYLVLSIFDKNKTNFLEKEFIKEINKKLPKSSRISKIILIDNIPCTNTGKVQRSKIKNWINKGNFNETKLKDEKLLKKNYFKPSSIVEKSKEAISITYNNLVYDLKARNKDVITLSLGEAFFDIPLFSFSNLPFPHIYHYSHSRGIIELRKCLSEYFLDSYGIEINPESEILITAGSKIAIYMSLMTILNPGDEVLILEPAWVSYIEQVKLCHGVPVSIPFYESIFSLEKFISNRTKLIIINNPNNPSGKIYSLEELNFLLTLSQKYNFFILSDEAYSEFTLHKEDFISLGNLDNKKDKLLIVNSISKNYGISGWRLGYVITSSELINQILKLNQHLITCPPTILQHYIVKYFHEIIEITYPQIKDLLEKRNLLIDYMNNIKLDHLEGTATFYFFISIANSKLSSETFCRALLNEHNIAVVPGIGYGNSCDKFIRISIGSESIERIKKALYTIKILIDKNDYDKE